jgi:hypothetical protein
MRRDDLDELNSVSERVISEEPSTPLQRKVVGNLEPCAGQIFAKAGEALDGKCDMRLSRRAEILFHAKVKLLPADGEPAAATTCQRSRLGNLGQPENAAVERADRLLAALGDCDLDVIERSSTARPC